MSIEKVSELNKQKIYEAVARAVATSPDPAHIRIKLFQLTREVKTITGFNKPINDTFKSVLKSWYLQSGKNLEEESLDIYWAQFKTSWDKIKFSTEEGIFFNLFDIAEQSQYPLICNEYNDIAKELIRFWGA